MAARVEAAQLPVPCVAGNCGKGPSVWVTSGAATATVSANTLRVTQTTDQAVLNWASFNVSADGHVIFQQPSSTSVALNRIFQESPSNIFGRVDANGQIYLVNPNGFVFGPTAKVNAAGILASTLWMKDTVFQNGILSPNATGNRPNPALEGSNEAGDLRVSVLDANDQPVLGQDGKPIKVELVVQQGAQIASSGVGGRVLLASQSVTNAGTVSSPDGQVIVAAGQRVYLQASADPSLRGLLVEVDVGGKAWNQLSGQLQAARGNVTVAGMAVNQDGRVSASSTVSANGSIRLVAQDTIAFAGANQVPVASHTGSVELGSQSVTEVLPELTDTATAVDEQAQLPSKIDIAGEQVILKGGSRITAPSGQLTVTAVQDLSQGSVFAADSNARIHVDTGATIDLSGSTATLPMSSNLVTVELRGNELATSPDQRNGALRGKPVVVDARVGTPLADVSAAIAAIPKTIAQRTSTGGQAVFQSAGDVVVANGATVNVSGGAVNYLGGTIATSQLITADGKFVDIGQADPTVQYIGVFTPTITVKHDRWGVIDSIPVAGIGHYEQGYTQGSAAGTVKFVAPQMVLNGTFVGHSVNGPYQRTPATAAPGGTLVIGAGDATTALGNPNYLAPSVNFSTTAPPIAVGDDGSLPGALPVTLPTDFLTEGGFTRTEIYSNGTVTIPGGTPLSLLSSFSYNRDPTATSSSTKLAVVAGSSLLVRAPQVSVRSDITASGGSIDIGSTVSGDTPANPAQKFGIDVASGVTLDVRGTWINDSLLPIGQRAADPLLQAGGTIKLSADADLTHETVQDGTQSALTIGSGVQLHASGGAWFQTSGKLTPGAGGNLTLSSTSFTPTNSNSTFSLGDNIGLDAFGVAGAAGGSFTLRAGRIDIG
ncbi:MAG TPA: filamentous hemagglutinin N-terminal domain-containing protein, partial [Steroidobacteraceae bacterium]|nr:filamentous hemagglutinin N-terminal domain-containing protein [Steroidobacteraceae bacterium]